MNADFNSVSDNLNRFHLLSFSHYHRWDTSTSPEFRDLRQKHDFFEICETPELSCEATLQPIRRFEGLLDAAIIFSDILVIPRALGLDITIEPDVGPVVKRFLVNVSDINRLKSEEEALSSLTYVYDAIRLTRKKLNGKVPLIGFSGGPWTLMRYMLEPSSLKNKQNSKRWIFKHPKETAMTLGMLSRIITKFLVEQAKAGAQMLQVFESWAGDLGPYHFVLYVYPHLLEIAENVKKELSAIPSMPYVPIVIFPRGIHDALGSISFPPYDVISVDWGVDPKKVRAYFPSKTLQGNLDPMVLLGSHEFIRSEALKMIDNFDPAKPYIANLGHGIDPETDPGRLRTFLSAIREVSPEKYIES